MFSLTVDEVFLTVARHWHLIPSRDWYFHPCGDDLKQGHGALLRHYASQVVDAVDRGASASPSLRSRLLPPPLLPSLVICVIGGDPIGRKSFLNGGYVDLSIADHVTHQPL